MAGSSRRPRPPTQGPRLPAAELWLQAQPRCRQQVGSCGAQLAPSASSSLPGAYATGRKSTTKSTRVHPGYLSLVSGSFRAGLGVATEGREAAHRGPPFCFLSFLCLLPFLSLSLLAVLLCLLGRCNLCLGRGQLSCSSLWLRQLLLWVLLKQRTAGVLPSRPSAPSRSRERPSPSFRPQVGQSGVLDVGQAASHLRFVPLLAAAVPNLRASSCGSLLLRKALNDSTQVLKLSFRVGSSAVMLRRAFCNSSRLLTRDWSISPKRTDRAAFETP